MSRMIRLVEEAQEQRSPSQRLAERFTRIFVPLVLVFVGGMIFVPPLAGWLAWDDSFLRAMTVLVGASPCALAISTPAAVLAGIGQAARHGVLVKGGMHLEDLGTVRAIAFDKTGTLTEGEPKVVSLHPAEGLDEATLLAVAAAIEAHSPHPLARAVVEEASTRRLALATASEVKVIQAAASRVASMGGWCGREACGSSMALKEGWLRRPRSPRPRRRSSRRRRR